MYHPDLRFFVYLVFPFYPLLTIRFCDFPNIRITDFNINASKAVTKNDCEQESKRRTLAVAHIYKTLLEESFPDCRLPITLVFQQNIDT